MQNTVGPVNFPRRAYKITSYWLTSLKPSKEPPDNISMEENAPLLDEGNTQKGCCGFRIYGPDGVWSWVVAFANFLVNFIIVGLGRMSGILYVDFMLLFNVDRTTAAIPFSIQQAGRNLFGPAAGILGQKYGLRAVTILGGVIGALSAAIIYFKMDITSITVLWGLFFGLSTALTTTLNQISIDQYFEKHRATAGGFAFSGGCVGAFVLPVVIETLIEHYTMRGTFLVLGSIILFVVPAAMIMVEPPWKQNVKAIGITRTSSRYGSFKAGESSKSDDSIEKTKANRQLTKDGEIKSLHPGIDFTVLQQNGDLVFRFLTMELSAAGVKPDTSPVDSQTLDQKSLMNELECFYASVGNVGQSQGSNISEITPFVDEQDSEVPDAHFEVSGSDNTTDNSGTHDDAPRRVYIQNRLKELYEARGLNLVSHFPYWDQTRAWKILIELRKLYDAVDDKPYLRTIFRNQREFRSTTKREAPVTPEAATPNIVHSNTFLSHIKTAVKLHGNPIFLLICLCRGVFMLTFIPVVTIIVDFAMDQGLPKSDGKYIIATMSLGDLIGRLCLGWITDCKFLSLPRYMLFAMLVLGGSTASLPLMESRGSFFAAVLIFGILQGSLFVRHALLVSQYMNAHEQSIGMGFINFLSGFLGFALPAFIGYFRDSLGSYNHMFYLNGIICAAVGLIWILEPLFLQICTATGSIRRERDATDVQP